MVFYETIHLELICNIRAQIEHKYKSTNRMVFLPYFKKKWKFSVCLRQSMEGASIILKFNVTLGGLDMNG